MKESVSDFSIVKNYIELKAKYDSEIKTVAESSRATEAKYKSHIAALEAEINKRNEFIKAQEAQMQELTRKLAEKDEQLKTFGLQLQRLKMAQQASPAGGGEDEAKKGKFGLFK